MIIHGITLVKGNYYHLTQEKLNWFIQYSCFEDSYIKAFSCADTSEDGSIRNKWKDPIKWLKLDSISSIRLATQEEILWYTKALGLESSIAINNSYSVF